MLLGYINQYHWVFLLSGFIVNAKGQNRIKNAPFRDSFIIKSAFVHGWNKNKFEYKIFPLRGSSTNTYFFHLKKTGVSW